MGLSARKEGSLAAGSRNAAAAGDRRPVSLRAHPGQTIEDFADEVVKFAKRLERPVEGTFNGHTLTATERTRPAEILKMWSECERWRSTKHDQVRLYAPAMLTLLQSILRYEAQKLHPETGAEIRDLILRATAAVGDRTDVPASEA